MYVFFMFNFCPSACEQCHQPLTMTLLGSHPPQCIRHSVSSGRVLQVNNSHKAEAPCRPWAEHTNRRLSSAFKTSGLRNQGSWKATTQPQTQELSAREWDVATPKQSYCVTQGGMLTSQHTKEGDTEAVKYSTPLPLSASSLSVCNLLANQIFTRMSAKSFFWENRAEPLDSVSAQSYILIHIG